jgi:hypothetical protein
MTREFLTKRAAEWRRFNPHDLAELEETGWVGSSSWRHSLNRRILAGDASSEIGLSW